MTTQTAPFPLKTFFRFTVDIPRDLPTQNHRLHWAERARRTKTARMAVYAQARSYRLAAALSPNRTEPRTLHLTLLRGAHQRLMDSDNLVCACKPIRDGLIDAGWLADDSPALLVHYSVDQRRDAKGPAVEICVGVPGGEA